MLFPQLQHELDDLAGAPDAYFQLMHHLVSVSEGTELPLTALLIFATSRRSSAAVEAFCQTIASDNHLMAPAIIRMHLDHLLTLHAAREHEAGADQYTYRRLEGVQTRRMNNGRGKKMHDAELIASIVEVTGDEWIRERHQIYSDFVHFGGAALRSVVQTADPEQGTATLILAGQNSIPSVTEDDVRVWISDMKAINAIIWLIIEDYISQRIQTNPQPT